MPTSEARLAVADTDAYGEALDAFRAAHVRGRGPEGVAQAYHAVRALPYWSGADRTPLTALKDGRGACTAKHLVLRDLLRLMGERAEVELVEGDFARGVPEAPTMPEALGRVVREGDVRDVHCRVWLHAGAGAQLLDATWPDAMEPHGFPVDRAWAGTGDTRQAMPEPRTRWRAEDVLAEKARLLAGFAPGELERRARFLRLLSEWIEGLA